MASENIKKFRKDDEGQDMKPVTNNSGFIFMYIFYVLCIREF